MTDTTIDKIAIYYAMEHDLNPKLVRDFTTILAEQDYKSLDSLVVLANSPARIALRDTLTALVEEQNGVVRVVRRPDNRTFDIQADLLKELRRHGVIR